jgi:hypothetical protein
MAAATGTVYALVDPRDDRVRYIGATTKTLKVRLYGHLKGPTAKRVKAWIDDLAASGLVPRIEPVTENVPADRLRDVEKDEITRRLIAGEQLLNEAATAAARRHIERQRELDRQERERAAWEHAAHQVRAAVGGPLPPGDIAPVPLNDKVLAAYRSICAVMDMPAEGFASRDVDGLSKSTRLMLMREKAGEILWRSTRAIWGRLRGEAGTSLDIILDARVSTLFRGHWPDLAVASRYLSLLPWGIVAVGPWAALAERAGMDATSPDFIDWVSDDASVREALTILLVRAGDRMGPLSALDDHDDWARPSTGLVTLAAAHCPGFDLPDALHLEVKKFLEVMERGGELTPEMVKLLLKLDPRALDNILGPDVLAQIDTRLHLPTGTSLDVITALQESNRIWHLRDLNRATARAKKAFPTVDTPDFTRWGSATGPLLQAAAASLVASGHLPAPSGSRPDGSVEKVRKLWRGNPEALQQAA